MPKAKKPRTVKPKAEGAKGKAKKPAKKPKQEASDEEELIPNSDNGDDDVI